MTFHGKRRWTDRPKQHPHESPALMTVPMIILAVGSAGLGALLGATHAINHWLAPVVGEAPEREPVLSATLLTVLTLVVVLLGLALAAFMYLRQPVPEVAPAGSILTRAARQDLYQDDVNEALLMRPGEYLTRSLVFVDGKGVDGAVGGLAALVGGLSARMRRLQNGFVRTYALTMLAGVVAVLGALAVTR
jgi:NADH-quinone oxidoreductase subunit L